MESICDEDFSELAQELGLVLSGLSLEFELSERPDENTIEVALYETADSRSLVGTLTKDVDYVYLSDRNAIRFQEDQIPPAQYFIEVRYAVLATGAVAADIVSLNLCANRVESFERLCSLPSLRHLNLSFNSVAIISALTSDHMGGASASSSYGASSSSSSASTANANG